MDRLMVEAIFMCCAWQWHGGFASLLRAVKSVSPGGDAVRPGTLAGDSGPTLAPAKGCLRFIDGSHIKLHSSQQPCRRTTGPSHWAHQGGLNTKLCAVVEGEDG